MTSRRILLIVGLVLIIVATVYIIFWPHQATAPKTTPVATSTAPTATSTATSTASAATSTAQSCADCLGLADNGLTIAHVVASQISLELPNSYNQSKLTVTPSGSLAEVSGPSGSAGNWVQTLETTRIGSSTILVPATSISLEPYVLKVITLDPAHSWEDGMVVVQKTDANQTLNLTQGTKFVVSFGSDLSWQLSFDKKGVITRDSGTRANDGIQGVFTASGVGTTTLTAVGGPICSPGQACPQFRINVPVYFNVTPASGGGAVARAPQTHPAAAQYAQPN